MAPTPKQVWNEQTKLLANLLNAVAAACLSLWILAPLAAYVYTDSRGGVLVSTLVGTPSGVAAAFLLHVAARRVLRRLRE